jgi:uroporphyrinogen-III synthase
MSLEGKTFITTVSAQKSERFRSVFSPLGATLIDFPMTDIREAAYSPAIEDALFHLEQYHWVIFTSGHGVSYFTDLWNKVYPSTRLPGLLRFAVVGKATAERLAEAGYRADYISIGQTGEDLGEELVANGMLRGCFVLLALGNLAPDTLANRLAGTCNVTRIDVYRNERTAAVDPEVIRTIVTGAYDLVIFTSPSAVEHFAEVILPLKVYRSLKTACIGRVTAAAAKKYDIPCLLVSEDSTYEGLAKQIEQFYNT